MEGSITFTLNIKIESKALDSIASTLKEISENMVTQAQVNELTALAGEKVEGFLATIAEEKAQVSAYIDTVNGTIADLKARVAELEANAVNVDLSGLTEAIQKLDTATASVKGIYEEPVVTE